jgi:glycerol-3-phosphate acyltransferase PlsY
MNTFIIALTCMLAYLLGSISTSIWYGRVFYQIDIREHGSGNAGASNTFRILGKKAGVVVLLIDALKGFMAASLSDVLYLTDVIAKEELVYFQLVFGILAIIGHVFPVFEKFKGGKGVATLLGMALALNLVVTLLAAGIFLLVLLSTGYISLGSMLATLSFPIFLLSPPFKGTHPAQLVFGFSMFVLVVLTHKKNILRLRQGTENRVSLFSRRRQD